MNQFSLDRHPANPILRPNPENAWEAKVVLNPAAVRDREGKFLLYYRAAGNDTQHLIHIGLAESRDGVHFERTSEKPILSPQEGNFDAGCNEDPRIVEIDGVTYMTYAYRTYPPGQYWLRDADPIKDYGVSPHAPTSMVENTTSTGLAIIQDAVRVKRLGRITKSDVDDRDVVLFPEKIGGKYWRLSRPVKWSGEGYPCEKPAIWINSSDSIMDWDEDKTQLLMKGEEWWEEKKIGAGTPPIKTDKGWLMIYHGVDAQGIYRVGAFMTELDNPCKIIGRTKHFILQPETEYERSGIYSGCVFPTGVVPVGDELYIYYGAADQFCCLATCKLNELIEAVLKN